MNRRVFVALLGGALSWPFAAASQPGDRTHLVGLLWGGATDQAPVRDALQELGWMNGNNVAFAVRLAIGNPDQFLGMASDLVQMKPDVIVATSAGLASLARQVTSTIPIVLFLGPVIWKDRA